MASIGPYDIERELGRGGMGRVLLGRHRETGARRAIKVLEGSYDPEVVERFRREAEVLARLGAEGVVPVHDSGVEHGRLWYAMGLMPGGSLHDRVVGTGPLPWREAARLGAKLARTLARAHALGLVHRDLKPANVLFDEHGEPRIADFGCARDLGAERLTLTGQIIGTPVYMAPEQLEGEAVDARADVFALGCILHELLVGARAHEGRTLAEIARAIRGGTRASVREVAKAPGDLEAVVESALAADRAARPDMATLARALDAVRPDDEKESAPLSRLALALVAAAVLLAATTFALVATMRSAPAPGPAPVDSPNGDAALLRRVSAETDPAGLAARELDAAIAATPSSAALRLARAEAHARWHEPLFAADLAAIKSSERIEALARDAERLGLSGTAEEVAALASVARSARGELGALGAVAAVRGGSCDEAWVVSATSVSAWGPALRLHRILPLARSVFTAVGIPYVEATEPEKARIERDASSLAAALEGARADLGDPGLDAALAVFRRDFRPLALPPENRMERSSASTILDHLGLDHFEAGPISQAILVIVVAEEKRARPTARSLIERPGALAALDAADPVLALALRCELATQLAQSDVPRARADAPRLLYAAGDLGERALAATTTRPDEHESALLSYAGAVRLAVLWRAALPEVESPGIDAKRAALVDGLFDRLRSEPPQGDGERAASARPITVSHLIEILVDGQAWSAEREERVLALARAPQREGLWLLARRALDANDERHARALAQRAREASNQGEEPSEAERDVRKRLGL